MARIRSIHPGIFTDEAFASLSMAARVLLLGVWTEADDHGVFEWKPVTLKMRVMPVDNVSIPELLVECERADVIKSFSSGKSYGLVRNFCRWQRPKKPKYTHPMPPEFFTYAGLNEDGSLVVLHQSRTGGETPPQREEEGGEGDEESGTVIEKRERPLSVSDSRPEKDRPLPIDDSYVPSEAAVEYAYSLKMKKADLDSELSKFINDGKAKRAVSFDRDASFKKRCDQWLDYQRKNAPKVIPVGPVTELTDDHWRGYVKAWLIDGSRWPRGIGNTPDSMSCRCPAPILAECGICPNTFLRIAPDWYFAEIETNELAANLSFAAEHRHRVRLYKFTVDGVEKEGAHFIKRFPPGYDEATGERTPVGEAAE